MVQIKKITVSAVFRKKQLTLQKFLIDNFLIMRISIKKTRKIKAIAILPIA
jgi:hypothetical protein